MKARSLSFRVALIAAGGAALALLLAGAVFIYQFSSAVERNFDDRLETLLLTLITATDAAGDVDEGIVEGESEGSFDRPLSGWYWQSRDATTGAVIDESRSLRFDLLRVPDVPTASNPSRTYTIQATGGRVLRARDQLVRPAPGHAYALLVAGDTEPMITDIRAFRNSVVRWLGGFAVLLMIGIAILVRVGLRPLRRVRQDLGKAREGEITHLEGFYPSEIEPLVQDLNALIDSNREIVERARTHVGNLAHALKTPLAVLQNETAGADGPLAAKVIEQVAIMRDQVSHHLNRARMAAQANVLGAVTPVQPVLDGVERVMRKVHQDRDLDIKTSVAPNLRFRGEKHDLEEMTGNLFDNACKWAALRVRVSAARRDIGRRPFFTISFDDDGPGLAESDREAALSRGQRLDESKPGAGLGLAIVVELARIYGGSLRLEDSDLGGLGARLTLPISGD
jgi:signal transduction histidine kinase